MEKLLLKQERHCPQFYTETLKNIPAGKYFDTPAFRMYNLMNLYVRIYPHGYSDSDSYKGKVSIYIYLDKMPPQLSKIRFKYQLKMQDTDNMWSSTTEWQSDGACLYNDRFCTSEEFFKTCKFWKFPFDFQILELWDKQKNQIGVEKYETKTPENDMVMNQSMENRINSIESRLDELTKMMQSLNTEIQTIKKKSMRQDIGIKEWLTDHVELPQYYDLFIKQGIDHLDIVKLITMDILKEMNIKLIG
eukprot:263065_1